MRVPYTVDFETRKIESRPQYPPKPVGVALRAPSGSRKYFAWGHPAGNNCSVMEARSALVDVYRSGHPVLFHNSGFDLDVAEVYFGLLPPPRIEDSLYLMFLNDPYEDVLKLKPLGAKHVDFPPRSQKRLREWIFEHVPEARRKKTKWGEYISEAPGEIVAPYAMDDVEITYRLWAKFRPIVYGRDMGPAYERELALTTTTMEMERSGVRVNRPRLSEAHDVFEKFDEHVKQRIRKRLRVGKDFNIGSTHQLGPRLKELGKLDAIVKTPSGLISTKVDVLKKTCNDKTLLNLLSVHSVADKYVGTFIRPWLNQSAITDGRILPHFNQTRGRDEGYGGARSGRYSSSNPNLQNITANVSESKNREILELMQKMLKTECDYDFIGLRDFIVPDEDTVMICVDYDQQELRLLAHFEQGVLMKAYIENPKLDVHEFCRQLVYKVTGVLYERKFIKITVFGIIYGMGLGKLANSIGVDPKTAKKIREGVFAAVPGIPRLMKDLKRLANRDEPLITWGGRQYFCEEPRFDEDEERWMSFEYKMLNYKIQPSAADVTKQGMIQVHERVPEVRIAIQVHDELVCMAPSRKYGPRIAAAMCDMKFKVPMSATAKYSEESWARAA
jgi:DNA polymerase-1